MKREQIINQLRQYFEVYELVDKIVFDVHGHNSWKFFSTDLLHCLLIIRKELGKPITINNWYWGGSLSQRGLRHNLSNMVLKKTRLYLSAHMMGKAIDFDVRGMTAGEVRKWINDNPDKFPCKIRLENRMKGEPISWVHLDIIDEKTNPKVYLFDV